MEEQKYGELCEKSEAVAPTGAAEEQSGQLSTAPAADGQSANAHALTAEPAAESGEIADATAKTPGAAIYHIRHTPAASVGAKVSMRPSQVLLGTGRSAQRPLCPDGTAAAAAPDHPQSAAVPRRAASMRDIAYAIVAAILSVFLVDCLLWHSAGLGTAVSAAAMYIATVLYLFGRKKHFDAYTAAIGVLFLLLSASLVFSDNGGAKFFAVTAMTILYAATVMDMASMRRSLSGTLGSVGDLFRTMFAQSFGKIGAGTWALFHKNSRDGKKSSSKTGAVLIGIVTALPVLAVIIPLLVSSDAAFEGLLKSFSPEIAAEIIGAVIVGLMLFIVLFSQAFTAPDSNDEVRRHAPDSEKGLAPAAAAAFSYAVSAVYILYLVSQLAYFFNAFSGILQDGYTMAQYARRGFFEMCVICLINLTIVFAANLITRKKNGRICISLRIPSVFICTFSLVLIATALSKMVMYISAYGMTRLRIYTSLFMVFLAVTFLFVILRLFISRVPYMKAVLLCAAVLIGASCAADIDSVVARYNVNAYLDGRLSNIDMRLLRDMNSDAAVPYVYKLTSDSDPEVASAAMDIMKSRFDSAFDVKAINGTLRPLPRRSTDMRGYNAVKGRAAKILLDDWEKYYRYRYSDGYYDGYGNRSYYGSDNEYSSDTASGKWT